MGKIKNRKRISADQVHSKKDASFSKKSLNPFEIHINKEKLKVLGRKQKNDRGLPGVSRAKAIQKRKHTLLQEYKVLNKSNKFFDKRIGEKSHKMTAEDKATARFTAVRVKAHNKKSIFNLADDEVLTHRGQTLNEIERFDDPRSDDESLDENESGKLDKKFVEGAHFGGGLLRNTETEGARTHKDLIDQLIAESKKRKAEKQRTKEATLELTEKLDTEWKDLLPIVNKSKVTEEDRANTPKLDDYDKIMRELRFEARGTVSDRLKSEDEVAKEEREKLEQLENDRLERMRGYIEEKPSKVNHRSADDLEDDLVYESDTEYMLSYNKEGESNVQVDAQINGKDVKEVDGNSDDDQDVVLEDENEEPSEDDGGADSEDDLSDLKEESSDNESDIEVDDSKEDELSVKVSEVKSDELQQEKEESSDITKVDNSKLSDEINVESELQQKIKADLLQRKEIMEKARQELPYTFPLPDSYESLQEMFENQTSHQKSVIIERIIKCNHPSLADGNKDNLGLLFAYLLQYLNDCFTDITDAESLKNSFEIFNALVPQIYDLANFNPENTHNSILEVLKEKQGEFRKKRKEYPGLEVLVFLRLISLLFSTSDFRHQVVTPAFVFIEQMLNKCKVRNKRDVSYGLFLVTIVLEYTVLSKRYLPAAINFLSGILHMAIPKSGVRLIKVVPPFKSISSHLVLLENNGLQQDKSYQMDSADLLNTEIQGEYKIRVVYAIIKLLQEFYDNFQELSSRTEIFDPILKYLEMIPTNIYPKDVKNLLEDFTCTLKKGKIDCKLAHVVMEAKRPKALRLYEPKIVEVYDGKRFKVQSKAKAERDKMLHKLKKEKKGALREVRRDNAFLSRIKIQQRIRSDKERKEKVNRLYAEAAMQQSELKQLDRTKKKRK